MSNREDKINRLRQAHEELLNASADAEALNRLEREIAGLEGEEYAVPVETSLPPWRQSSHPCLLMRPDRAFLIYRAEPSLSLGGQLKSAEETAVVTIEGFHCAREVASEGTPRNHRLHNKGIRDGLIFTVQNSRWLRSVSSGGALAEPLKHYLFFFGEVVVELIGEFCHFETYHCARQNLPLFGGKDASVKGH